MFSVLRPVHLFGVIGVNFIFAGAYLAGKAGVGHFPPLFFSGLRFLLLFICLLPFFRLKPVSRSHFPVFIAFCLAMGVGVYATMYLALAMADGVSGILIGTQFTVPIATLLGVWLLGDKVSGKTWFGVWLAFAGVMIVGYDNTLLGYWQAFLLILLSAFFYALSNVLSRRLTAAVNLLTLNVWMALLGMPFMFISSALFEVGQWDSIISADYTAWGVLLYSALAVSIIAHIGMFSLLRRYPVSTIMPFYVLMPIFGVIGGIIFFDEQPSSAFYIGAVIALYGVWIVNRRKR